jgi:multiple antibiotic resistance protein
VGVSQLGLNSAPILGLLLLVMLLNLLAMLAARSILGVLKPVTLQVLGFALAVMQLALGIEFILSGIELQALVIQRMMAL